MPQYEVEVPGYGKYRVESPTPLTDAQAYAAIQDQLVKRPEPQGGFLPAAKAGLASLKGDIAGVLGRTGLMDVGAAEKYRAEQEAYRQRTFKPTEEGWTDAPLTKIAELAGGSVPYMAAPLVVGGGAALAGAPALVGAGAAGLASAGQFVGSNLSRQVEEGTPLAQTNLQSAAMAAVPQAALDMVGFRMVPGIRRLFGAVGEEIAPKAAAEIAKQGVKKIAADYTLATGKAMTAEGLTEAGQQVFERLQAGLSLTDPEARKEYLDNFIGGAVLGGVMAPAGRYMERGREQAQAQELQQIEAAKTAQEQEANEQAALADPGYAQKLKQRYADANVEMQRLNDVVKELGANKDPLSVEDTKDAKKARDDYAKNVMKPLVEEIRRVRPLHPGFDFRPNAPAVPAATVPAAPETVVPAVPTAPETAVPAVPAATVPGTAVPAVRTKKAKAAEVAPEVAAPVDELAILQGKQAAATAPRAKKAKAVVSEAEEAAPDDLVAAYVEALMGDPETAAEIVKNNEPIEGLDAAQQAAVIEELNRRLAQLELTGGTPAPAEDTTVEPTEPRTLEAALAAMQPKSEEASKEGPYTQQTLIPGTEPKLARTGAVSTPEGQQAIQAELKRLSKEFISARQEGRKNDALAIIERMRYLKEQAGSAEAGPRIKGRLETPEGLTVETQQAAPTSTTALKAELARARALPNLTGAQVTLLDRIEDVLGVADGTTPGLKKVQYTSQAIKDELQRLSKEFSEARKAKRKTDAKAIIQKMRSVKKQTEGLNTPVAPDAEAVQQVESFLDSKVAPSEALANVEYSVPTVAPKRGTLRELLSNYFADVRSGGRSTTPLLEQTLRTELAARQQKAQQAITPRELHGMLVKTAKLQLSGKEKGLLKLVGENQDKIMADDGARRTVARWLSQDIGQGIGDATQALRQYFGIAEEPRATVSPLSKAIAERTQKIEAGYAEAERGLRVAQADATAPLQKDLLSIQRLQKQLAQAQEAVSKAQAAVEAAKTAGAKRTAGTQLTTRKQAVEAIQQQLTEQKAAYDQQANALLEKSASVKTATERLQKAQAVKNLLDTSLHSSSAGARWDALDDLDKLFPLKTEKQTPEASVEPTRALESQEDMFAAEKEQEVKRAETRKSYEELLNRPDESKKAAERDEAERKKREGAAELAALPGQRMSFERRQEMLRKIDYAPIKRQALQDRANDGNLSQEERDAAQEKLTKYLEYLRKDAEKKDRTYGKKYRIRGETAALAQELKTRLGATDLTEAQRNKLQERYRKVQRELVERDIELAHLRGVEISPIETPEQRLETLERLHRETYGQAVSDEQQELLDKTKGRALGPVTRKERHPAKVFYTGEEGSKDETEKRTYTRPDMRLTEARGQKTRNVQISEEEMKEANKYKQYLKERRSAQEQALLDYKAQADAAVRKISDLNAKLTAVKDRQADLAKSPTWTEDKADALNAQQESIQRELDKAKEDWARLANQEADAAKGDVIDEAQRAELKKYEDYLKEIRKRVPVANREKVFVMFRGVRTPVAEAIDKVSETIKHLKESLSGSYYGETGKTKLSNKARAELKATGLLSRGTPTNASTVESITNELAESGIVLPKQKTHVRRQAQPAKLTVLQSVADFTKAYPAAKGKIPSDAKGLVYKERAFLFADNIGKGEALGVVLHEVGAHIGFRNFFNPAQYNAIATTVKNWAKRNDGSVEAKIGKAALERVAAAATPADQVDDEIIAYAVEEAVKAGVQPTAAVNRTAVHNWLKMVVDAFKKALGAFGINPTDLKAGDLVNFAYGCAQLELHGTWHGSDATFTAFDTAFAGQGEGAYDRRWGDYGAGPFVTPDKPYAEFYQEVVPFGKAANASGYGDMSYQQYRKMLDTEPFKTNLQNLSFRERQIFEEFTLLNSYLLSLRDGHLLNPTKNKKIANYVSNKKNLLKNSLKQTKNDLEKAKKHNDSLKIANLKEQVVKAQRKLAVYNTLDVSKIKGLTKRPKLGNLYRTLDDVPDERVYQVNSSFTVGDRPKLDALLEQHGDEFAKQSANEDGKYPANSLFFDMREKLGVDETLRLLKAAGIDAIEQNNEGGRYVERVFIGVKPEILGTNLEPIGQVKGPLFSRTATSSEGIVRPSAVRYAPGLEGAGATADKLISKERGAIDKARAAAGGWLGLETQFVDRFAGFERLSKTMDSLKGMQMMYYLRMYDQKMNFTAQSVSNGALQVVSKKRADGRTEHLIESVKGANIKQVVDILKKAPAGSPDAANRLFSLYLAGIRAANKGFDTLHFGSEVTEAQLRQTMADIRATPGLEENFKKAREVYNEYNRNQMNFLAQSGAISKDLAARLTQENDYIPFYREQRGAVELVIGGENPIRIGNLTEQPYLHELVGGDRPILDFLTSSVQNTSMINDMALRNLSTRNAAIELSNMKLAQIREGRGADDRTTVRYKVDGKDFYAIIDTDKAGVPADILVKGMQGIPTQMPAAIRMLGLPAKLLRTAVQVSPLYPARQLFRDSLAATVLSGANFTPILGSLKELGKSTTKDTLERRGITGGQIITGTSEDMSRILKDMMSNRGNLGTLIAKAEALNMEADAATRRAQYNSYIKQGLSEMEATLMSLESMNFNKRGASPSIHMANALIPFFNSQIQGLNVLYKALTGKLPFNERLKIQEKLITRGLMIAAGSLAYAALMQDDEAYKNATPDQKYGNWFVRLPGVDEPVRVPIPFEIGYIFKALPEALYNSMANEHGSEEAFKAMQTIVKNTIPGGSSYLVPQAMKPLLEYGFEKSFYTGRDTLSAREKPLLPEQQFREGTTELAKAFSGLGLSPIKVEELVRGYTGTMGLALMQAVSVGIPTGESPEKTAKRLSNYPVVGGAFQPNDAGGIIDAVYEKMLDAKKVQTTVERLTQDGRVAEARELVQRRGDEFAQGAMADYYISHIRQITALENAVRASDMTGDEKRAKLDQTRQMKIKLAESVRKATDEAKKAS